MKTILKVVGALVGLVVVAAAVGVGVMSARKPAQRPPPDLKVELTPARIERGRYLAEVVANCIDCHSDHALTAYGLPVKPGSEGRGGLVFDEGVGVPGVVVARNLTPDVETGKGGWSDGELIRAFREGIDRDGAALFPMMPYEWFRAMSDDDAQAIVAYLRTLKPAKNTIAARRIDFPASLFVKLVPQPLSGPVTAPTDAQDHLGYGKYLATIAGCIECHTPKDDRHQRILDQTLAGGFQFKGPWGNCVSANITGVPNTFMATASKEEFIGRFRSWQSVPADAQPPRNSNTVMPWRAFSKMTDADLSAIYDYLKSLKPVGVAVAMFPDAR